MKTSTNFTQSGAHQRRTQAGVLSFDVDDTIEELTRDLDGFEKQVELAVRRALKKIGKWLRTHTMRQLGKEMGIKQASIKNRFILSYDKKTNTVSLWVGLLAIAAEDLGNASQNAAGVRVGKRQYDGAFFTSIYDEERYVYIRARRNRVMQHDVVRQDRKAAKYRAIRDPQLKGRFPVQRVGVAIQEQAHRIILILERQINRRFGELLKQELNYAINIESAK